MKKASKVAMIAKPLAVAAVLACACAAAQAQSNVTIYGRIDAGVNYQSGVQISGTKTGSQWGASGNEWGTSMIGVMGTEDLGGGLNAFFKLENGFNADNGAVNGGSGLWTRRSYVGLTGAAGTVKVGKDLAIENAIWDIDPTGQQAMSTSTLVNVRNWPQTNNMVSYQTPSFGGFSTTYMHGFGEVAGSFTASSSDGLALTFVQPNYELLAVYDVQRDANGQYSTLYGNSKDLILGGTLTIDKMKLFTGYEKLKAPSVTTGANSASQYWLGANYQLSPALLLIAAAYHTNVNAGIGSANLFMLGANYSLSKRTLLYASVGTLHNSAASNFTIETGTGATGANMNALYFGVSHSF